MKILTFSKSEKGSSHETNGKPMQDWSEHLHLENCHADIILLSDGHGSDKHFRSDRGAKFAVEAAKESIIDFIEVFSPLFIDKELVQKGIHGIKDSNNEDFTPKDPHEREFRQLFENIKFRWCEKVTQDWKDNPPTEEELRNANTQGRELRMSYYQNGKEIKAYGCTLISAIRTPDFWFAFQIGDGKCIAFREDGSWFEPIPWDSRCFLTTTTSLCHEGSESFRYCYGRKSCPALFIGSDGMDDSYMPLEKLAEFYGVVIRVVADNGLDYATEQLCKMMPVISEKGSHDDISIAFWIEEDKMNALNKNILSKKLEYLEQNTKVVEEKKKEAEDRREEISERAKQLNAESDRYISKRTEYNSKIEEIKQSKKKAEEDFEDARFQFAAAKKNLEEVNSDYESIEMLIQKNEHAYELHLREVTSTESLSKEIEKKILELQKQIAQELQERIDLKNLLIKFGF